MKNLVVINLGSGGGWARKIDGTRVLDRVLEYGGRLTSSADLRLITPPEEASALPSDLRPQVLKSWTDGELLRALIDLSRGYDQIYYVYGDAPFLDSDLALKMMENHLAYHGDYNFADGYPYGLAPEIIKTAALPALMVLVQDPPSAIQRDTLFSLISRDINSFDLETEISPVDLRQMRVSLTTDTERNSLLCRRLAEEKPRNAEDVCRILQEKGAIHRTLPAYLGVQIVEGCPQACFSCPYPLFGGDILNKRAFMDPEAFDGIAEKVASFCGDAVLGVSLWGEPALHPDFLRLARSVAERPGLSLLVETSGIGWKDETLRETEKILGEKISWIVSLDTLDSQLYQRIRGPGYTEAMDRAKLLLEIFPRHTYVQALRMEENEEGMEDFFRYWREKTPQVIIQKYDYFCGYLPQRKPSDLSPLERFPCRHLERDLSILIDGTVPLCREDLKQERILGNIFTEDLSTLWARGEEVYREHLAEKYQGICGACDEYYTYNF